MTNVNRLADLIYHAQFVRNAPRIGLKKNMDGLFNRLLGNQTTDRGGHELKE